ncbi:hypothetical protein D9613_006564 [Agrocybe pediades]|uniref:Carboxylic ester hydrolase n=1 Tax=Agrocybe pediades TaxID=84607 RepID=A0A8H4VK86_9AGAR|nr:hypothetical protein D9613_006564 [Agrocybe pediades]
MWTLAFALIPAFLASLYSYAPDVPLTRLDYALVVGRREGSVDKFLGIKFAEAPRFKLPILVSSYSGYVQARSYGAACPQQKYSPTAPQIQLLPPPEVQSEDCLTVNIMVPKGTKRSDKLPVAVYIHGGALQAGSAQEYDYSGAHRVERSIELGLPFIQVSINYRVSAYGFLSGLEVAEEEVANIGLYDQREALRWVNKYISAFGGDPSRVTLNGASAGAISVAYQMLAFGGNPENLFQAAFPQSGAIIPSPPMAKGQVHFDALVARTGCASSTKKLECLRKVPLDALRAAVDGSPDIFSYSGGAITWLPVVDGKFVQDSPYQLVLDGKVAKIPIVTGVMDDEGTVFSFQQANQTADEHFEEWVRKFWFPNATPEELEPLWKAYPSTHSEGSPFDTGNESVLYPQFKRVAAFQGDALFQAPRRFLTQNLAKRKEHKIWVYMSKRNKNFPHLGSFHGSDFFLGFLDDFFIRFVSNHDPNSGEGVFWPEYTAESPDMYTFHDAGECYLSKDNYREQAMNVLTNIFRVHPL